MISLTVFPHPALVGQPADGTATLEQFRQHLSSAEFGLAEEMARANGASELRDQMNSELAIAQRNSGVGRDSFENAAAISNDDRRLDTLARISSFDWSPPGVDSGSGNDGEPGIPDSGGVSSGGITAQDFSELIDLIEETIDPDNWEVNGGTGRMRPFPSGVFVDGKGVLRLQETGTGDGPEPMLRAADVVENHGLTNPAGFRAVSLTRLERALQMRAARGEDPAPEMMCLGGIYRLTHVVFYPETRDVVIGGPAGPWHYDGSGRAINDETGQPVLNLDDLVICLRNAQTADGQFWCSIDPVPANLAAAQQVIAADNLSGPALRRRLQETLGRQNVTVEGIDPATHAGHVIVAADYHMKLIGMGVAGSVDGVPNYLERIVLDDDGNVVGSDNLVRWWFSMNYDSVRTNRDRTVFEICGPGVKLLSESEFWTDRGERQHSGKSSTMAAGFAEDFTRHFEAIARKYPVYGELRNLFDCSVAANLIVSEGLNRKIDWRLNHFVATANSGGLMYRPQVYRVPVTVDSVAGQRIMKISGSNKVREITNVSGGVEFDSRAIIGHDRIVTEAGEGLSEWRADSRPDASMAAIEWIWDGGTGEQR
jgi:hypothetical protein